MAIQVLLFLEKQTLSKSEIAQKLGKRRPSRYLNDLMARLLREKYTEYTIPAKPNSRLQQYRLTQKGKSLLARTSI